MEAGVGTGISAENLRKRFGISDADIRTYSPLTFAYIGDGVFDIVVRTILVAQGNTSTEKLDRRCAAIVCASSQAAILKAISPELTSQEADIARRGRNSKPKNTAKHASRATYLEATGFEALLGYLYLNGQVDRLQELIQMGLERVDLDWKEQEGV